MVAIPVKRFLSVRLIRNSGLFDPVWYRARYPDISDLKGDPIRHYVLHGAAEGRDPSGVFDTAFYLTQYPDLDVSKIPPLSHYILVGEAEGAWPNPYFDPAFVRTQIGRVLRPGQNVLATYLSLGASELSPSNRLCAQTHLAVHKITVDAGVSSLSHHLSLRQNLDPNALLSTPNIGVRMSAMSGLVPFAFENGFMYLHVQNDDPYIVLNPVSSDYFEPGHYRLKINFSRPEDGLKRARFYFDYGLGFDEDNTIRAVFDVDESGTAVALIPLNEQVHQIRFDPLDARRGHDASLGISRIELSKISSLDYYRHIVGSTATSAPHSAKLVGRTLVNALKLGTSEAGARLRAEHESRKLGPSDKSIQAVMYRDWIKEFDAISEDDRAEMDQAINAMANHPKFSVVMPVYNTPIKLLRECIESVLHQIYPNWELCIADDNSSDPEVREVLEEYAKRDDRIKVVFRTENGHISRASNSAIEVATGDWIALLDHDDLLAPNALFCMADAINSNPNAKMLYSDEDKVDLRGARSQPYFKSAWNERLLFEQNMVCHLAAYDADLVQEIGGLREGFEGAQDHDLVLRVTERIRVDQIVHIPHILYHWRVMPGSTALDAGEKSYALEAGIKALQEAVERRGLNGHVEAAEDLSYYRLKLNAPEASPLVSIVIPTRDGLDVLKPCVDSVLQKTTYSNFEILIVDNQSEKDETLEYFKELEAVPNVRVLLYDDKFNYSAINNFAVHHSAGSLVCLLNNDTEVISPDWLTEMVAELSQSGVGAVGAKLLYTDGTVQHAGVVLGIGAEERGVAGHGMVGIPANAEGYFSYARLAREVSAVTAACLLTRRDIFENVGGLNEDNLQVAFNDIDFCLKIREAGHRIIWTPYALLHHHESKSRGFEDTPEKIERFERERDYMLDRWGDVLRQDPYYNPNLALDRGVYTLSLEPRVSRNSAEPTRRQALSLNLPVQTPPEVDREPELIHREALYSVQKAPAISSADDVVVLVLFSPDGRVTELQNDIIQSWKSAGFKVILVVNAAKYDEHVATGAIDCEGLIVRENIGFDFGAWRQGLQLVGGLDGANLVVLANDSVLPVNGGESLKNYRKRVDESEADIAFCTRNLEVKPHLQSYAIAIKNSALRSGALNQFRSLNYHADKIDLIHHVEVNISDQLSDAGHVCEALYHVDEAEEAGVNPTIHYWEELIDDGFPFWKAQLITAEILELEDPRIAAALGQERTDKLKRHLAARMSVPNGPVESPSFVPSPAFGHFDDYNEHGAQNACNPGNGWLRPIALPLDGLEEENIPVPRIFGVIHCFYTDVARDILDELAALNLPMRLLLTTDTTDKQAELVAFIVDRGLDGDVVVTPNRGRDVAPFLIEGGRHIGDAEMVFHLHTKKSKHDERYADWGKFLRENLIGSEAIVRSILKLFTQETLGLVYSEHFREVRDLRNWGFDFEKARALLARMDCHIDADNLLEFPTSTMFWARRDVLQPLFDLRLSYEDFDPEEGQIDGTLAHAIERSFLYVCENEGFQFRKVVSKTADGDHLANAAFLNTDDLAFEAKLPITQLLPNHVNRANLFHHVGEVYPVEIAASPRTEARLNLVLPTLKPQKVYGGISTAIATYKSLADALGVELRVLVTTDNVDMDSIQEVSRRLGTSVTLAPPRADAASGATVVDIPSNLQEPLAVRSTDIFFATAWWTADLAFRLKDAQQKVFEVDRPVVYLIQDYEPGFYSWSENYAMAEATYHRGDDTLAIINSEELFGFMQQRYDFRAAWYVPYTLNERLDQLIRPTPKEKSIICYGRPGTPRNCFHILVEGLRRWQRENPAESEGYEIVFAGEPFDPAAIGALRNARVVGKMTLDDYADMLNRSALGVSLMVSPHPSYPPLEMANAGCLTITNAYEGKDVSRRSDRLISLASLSPATLADALKEAVRNVEIGATPPLRTVKDLLCDGQSVDFDAVAESITSAGKTRTVQ